MKLVYEDDFQVAHEDINGGRITSLKKCRHGVNIWDGKWNYSLCKDCSQPERSKREDVNSKTSLINNPFIKESIECFINDAVL